MDWGGFLTNSNGWMNICNKITYGENLKLLMIYVLVFAIIRGRKKTRACLFLFQEEKTRTWHLSTEAIQAHVYVGLDSGHARLLPSQAKIDCSTSLDGWYDVRLIMHLHFFLSFFYKAPLFKLVLICTVCPLTVRCQSVNPLTWTPWWSAQDNKPEKAQGRAERDKEDLAS